MSIAAQLPTLCRDATPDDYGAIISWWQASCRRIGGRNGPPIASGTIKERVARHTCTVMTPADSPGHILGWAVWEPPHRGVPVVHYMAVRGRYQGNGFGTLLASHCGVVRGGDVWTTEQPNPTMERILKGLVNLRWVPYRAWRKGEPFRGPCEGCGRMVWSHQDCPDCIKRRRIVVEVRA